MTQNEVAIGITEMHAIATAETPVTALLAVALVHPVALTVGMVAVFPHLHEVVVVDITLVIIGTDTGTGGYGAVGHDGAYGDSCLTVEEHVANLAFVTTQKTLATIGGINTPLLARLTDEVKHTPILLISNLHHRVFGRTAYGENGVDTPVAYTLADEIVADGWQLVIITLVDTGYHVRGYLRMLYKKI